MKKVLSLLFVVIVLMFALIACNNKTPTTTTTKHEHVIVIDEAVESTCKTTGLTYGVHCSECDEIIVPQEETPLKDHTEVIDSAVAPTCTATGLTEGKHCSLCDTVLVEQTTIPAKGHTEVIDGAVAATCTKTGLTQGKHCSVCGTTLVAQTVIAAKGHSFGTWGVTTAPTCTATGVETRRCSCGATETRTVAAKGHREVIDAAKSPTCTQTGLTQGKHCSVCGTTLVAQTVVGAKGHSFGAWGVTTAPTCTATGVETRRCSCGATETRTVAAKGHREVIDAAKSPTCTQTGLTQGKHCSVCGTTLVAQTVIAAKGHSWNAGVVTTHPTCTATGIKTFTCNNDSSHTYTTTIPADGHTEGETVVENNVNPDCVNNGSYDNVVYCSICSTELSRITVTVSAKGHTEVIDVAKSPTCTQTGLTQGKHCSVCNEILVAQTTVDALGHKDANKDHICDNGCGVIQGEHTDGNNDHDCDYGCSEAIGVCEDKDFDHNCDYGCNKSFGTHTENNSHFCDYCNLSDENWVCCGGIATCTEKPQCSVCGNEYGSALGHIESDWKVSKQPTENEPGQKYTECTRCGKLMNTVEIPATHEHNYTDWIEVESYGCSAFSYKFKYCLDCGNQIIDAPDGADTVHPHEFEKITKEATCTENGIEYRFECKNCHFVAAEKTTEALGHIFDGNTYKQFDKAYHTQTCARCGQDVKEAHSLTGFIVTDAPSCEDNGIAEGTCDKCGESGEILIPAIGHLFAGGEYTYVNESKHLQKCQRCEKMISQGHTVLVWTTTLESTCTSTGIEEGDCIYCGGHTKRTTSENHSFVFVSFTPGSSCMDGGSANYVCSKCGADRTIDLLAPGHDYVHSHTITEPTCTTLGTAVKVCSRCGDEKEYTLYALGHNYSGGVTIKVADCYNNGLVRYTCQRNGCSAVREVTVNKSHSFDNGVVTKTATCTSNGEIVYTCSDCKVTVEYTLPAKHNFTYHKYIGATCTNDGSYSYYTCDDCGKYFTNLYTQTIYLQCDGRTYFTRNHSVTRYTEITHEDTVIHAYGHSYTSYYNQYDSQNHYRYCANGCGTLLESGAHTLIEKWVVKTERVTGGYEYYLVHKWECTKCGYYAYGEKQLDGTILDGAPIKIAEEHNSYVVIQPTLPTCTESGLDVGLKCGVCDEILYEQEILDALGHNYVGNCCSRCGCFTYSQGLVYTLNSDGQSYSVTDIGTCTDTDVIIPSTYNGLPVTNIGSDAFHMRESLTSIKIPDSVTTIGDDSFRRCTSLRSVDISSTLTSIGEHAFYYCTSLTNITIPDTVTSIGEYAFYYCTSLTNITIPDTVISIGSWAFSECTSLTRITFKGNIPSYSYSDIPNLTTIVLKNGVTNIGKNAFRYCTSLTNVTISDTVTSIGEYAFYYCTSLTNITIPDTVTSIGNNAFQNCKLLTSVTFDENSQLTSIGEYAFYYCTSLTNVTIPDTLTSIGEDAFSGCSSLTSVTFGENSQLTSIGEDAFRNCTSLTSIEIPASVTSIGYPAFSNCTSLTRITFKGNIPSYFYHDIPNLTTIVLKNGVTSIDSSAFFNCTSLTNITIPDSVISIGDGAFDGCTSLTSITFGENSQLTSIGAWAFANCTSLTSIEMPAPVTSIGYEAFQNCTSLESIDIPASVTSIRNLAFRNCTSLTSIEVDENNTYYKSIDGNLYNKAGTILIKYAIGKKNTLFTISSSVTSIGSYAFSDCTSLTSITFGENSQLTSIYSSAFSNCTSLESIEIPASVTSIGYEAFSNCTSLESIEVDENNTYYKSIDGNLYNKAGTILIKYAIGKKNTLFTISSSVTSIGSYAFSDCTSLISINFEGTIEQWNAIKNWDSNTGSYTIYCTDGEIAKDGTVTYY